MTEPAAEARCWAVRSAGIIASGRRCADRHHHARTAVAGLDHLAVSPPCRSLRNEQTRAPVETEARENVEESARRVLAGRDRGARLRPPLCT
jgi:hypothetical protein